MCLHLEAMPLRGEAAAATRERNGGPARSQSPRVVRQFHRPVVLVSFLGMIATGIWTVGTAPIDDHIYLHVRTSPAARRVYMKRGGRAELALVIPADWASDHSLGRSGAPPSRRSDRLPATHLVERSAALRALNDVRRLRPTSLLSGRNFCSSLRSHRPLCFHV
jgi:hypothetical protein